jgi:hypothetical protein
MFARADGLPDEAQRAELLKTLEADTKTQLQEAGIPFSKSKYADDLGKARLVILVTLDQLNGFVHPIVTEVQLVQRVHLARDPSIELDAVTWSRDGVGGPKLEIPMIRDQIGRLIDRFIRDYRSVNPTQSASSRKDSSKDTKR